ncbi:hypothetical protein F3K02_13890 [Hydrogenophaga sp. D2P1]|uniref:TnsA endonuclease N-terminal domain-containing protein n=1 Tax=Hydrogenophaga aromaticivorans TaxID=2610898 RepID=A0A7Y8KYP6_9BURK|nr:TnsA endonuclease N-terminal domain-containing protein [Hydrogenophaga aromaticivorans]NWF46333.1 hypothetical protein [Hydrogenophaga aromaticivorans]
MEPAKRKVVQRSPAHTVRRLHLPHLPEAAVEADSSVERDFVLIASLYVGIKSIQHQPFILTLGSGSYTPDFLLQFQDQTKAVVEVKPTSEVPKYEVLFAQAKEKLAQHGMLFIVARDTVLRKDSMAERAMKIRRYAKTLCHFQEQERALELVQQHPTGVSIRKLMQARVTKPTLYYLIAHRRLQADEQLNIEDDAIVSLPKPFPLEASHAVCFARWLDA